MELLRTVGPGGARDATDVTSGATVYLDLAAFAGRYVTLTWDQAMYFSLVPATGTFTLDSGTGAIAANAYPGTTAEGVTATIVPERVALDAVTSLAVSKDVFVPLWFPRLAMRAQGTTATYTEVKVTSEARLGVA